VSTNAGEPHRRSRVTKEHLKVCFRLGVRLAPLLLPETARQSRLELSPMQTIDPEDRSSEHERLDVLGLAKDPVRRRSWLLYMARKALPFDQAVEWARTAEQFITGSPPEALAAEAPTRCCVLAAAVCDAPGPTYGRPFSSSSRTIPPVSAAARSCNACISRATKLARFRYRMPSRP
jgi:hypothetical protein